MTSHASHASIRDKIPHGRWSIFLRIVRIAWFAILFIAVSALAQQRPTRSPSTPAQKLYRIAGTVTNSVTGEPIAHATVNRMDEESGEAIQTTETGSDGQFALEGSPAGKFGLRVAKRGFLTSFFDEHDQYSSAIVTGEDRDTEHIPFHLKPGARMHGTVTDDAGEPVQDAQVFLVRRTRESGLGERLVRSISGTTDDQGNFEFWDLDPGVYLLAVKASPWYALHPNLIGQNAGAGDSSTSLDVAYPVTYYDGTNEEAAATPITLASGDHAEINLALHAVPAIHLLVHTTEVSTIGNRSYIDTPMLRQTILGENQFNNGTTMVLGPADSGRAEIGGVAPGHYTVLQGNPPHMVDVDASGEGSQDVDMASATSTVNVDLKARMADGGPIPDALQLSLVSDDLGAAVGESRSPLKGVTHFNSMAPGNWNITARSNNLQLGVLAVESATKASQGSRITVRSHSLDLTVVLAAGSARVQGFALKDGKGLPGAMIVLVPQHPDLNVTLFRRDQSDSDGSFSLRDVVPGRYTVVAIEEGWGLDWATPEVIARYLPRGVSVTISSASGKIVPLGSPVPVQPR